MSTSSWHEEAISRSHDRTGFDCGDSMLNAFLQEHARKSHDRGASRTFVAVKESDRKSILGFYTVCPASIEYARTPEQVRKGLPRHEVPAFRLARLAVDVRYQGKGLGGQLLLAAGRRCLGAAQEVGGVALLIDAKSERAADWYASYGAIPLSDSRLTLVLPLETIRQALRIG